MNIFEEELIIVVESPNLGGVYSVNGKAGFVTINKSDIDLSNVENISIIGVSGYLQNQINNISGGGGGGGVTGDYYLNSNPSGFITGVDLSNLYPRNNPSGFITGVDLTPYATNVNLAATGSTLNTRINSLSGTLTGNYLTSTVVGNTYATITNLGATGSTLNTRIESLSGTLTGGYYPRNNPSGFITGIDLSYLYPRSNPSGFITSVDLSSYATNANLNLTGFALNTKINNLSGVSVLTFGDQIIKGIKYFNNDVYIHNLYVTGTEFVANVENNFIESPYILLNLTGGVIDGGIFFVTGTGLTGVNDYGPIIGFDHSNKFKFGIARRSDDLSILNDIAAVQDITNYSGFVDNKYYTKDNPSGFITGIDLSNYYTKNNPSGYITNQNVVFTTGDQNIDGTKTFSNKLIANSGADIYFSGTAGTGVSGSHVGVLVSGLWNNTGQIYTGILYNITLGSGVTPSATNNLFDILVNNTGVFDINSRGEVLIRQVTSAFANIIDIRNVANTSLFSVRDDGSFSFFNQGGVFNGVQNNAAIRNGAFNVAQQSASNQGYFGWSRSSDPFNSPGDIRTRLYRGDDFVLDLRNPLFPNSGHQFRVFNISGTNTGEFGVFGWQQTGTTGTPNALVIGTQATQSGILRDVILTGNIDVRGFTTVRKTSSATDFINIFTVRRGNTEVFGVRDDGATQAVGFSTPAAGAGHSLMNADGFAVRSVGSFRISSDSAAFSPDVFLRRDGPGIFAQYNGVNPQQYRIYNLTGTNSGEFGLFGWLRTGVVQTPNAFFIGTQATQSGTLRDVVITGENINISACNQTNFSNRPMVNAIPVLLSGEGGTVTLPNTIVYTTGNQTISGTKIFDNIEIINTSYNYFTTNITLGDNYINLANSTSGITVNLPSIVSGRNYIIKNLNTGILTVTGSNSIDENFNLKLYKNESAHLLGVNNIGFTGWVSLNTNPGIS
jgi:hypothetical protein